jgi:hypothetical protein
MCGGKRVVAADNGAKRGGWQCAADIDSRVHDWQAQCVRVSVCAQKRARSDADAPCHFIFDIFGLFR